MKNKIADFFRMTFGTILVAAGIYFFKIPNRFSTGGVSGIGTILGSFTAVSPATWILVLNIFLLILGFVFLGKATGAKTVYCTLLFSALTKILEMLIPLAKPLTNHPFLELCYAILLVAIGSAILFHCNASSGGTDIVALILKKYTSLNVGKSLLCVDFIIAFSSFFFFGIETGMFSLLGLFAKAFVVDSVIESMDSCKYFVIVTSKPDDITQYVLNTMHHGATVARAEGAYTHEDKTILHTVCRRSEALRLQRKVKELDPEAFIIITTSSEIIGRGFRSV